MPKGFLRRNALSLAMLAALTSAPPVARPQLQPGPLQAELFEGVDPQWQRLWSFEGLAPALTWSTPFLGVLHVPGRISPAGFTMERNRPFVVRISGTLSLAPGEYEFQLRSRNHARLYIDGALVAKSEPPVARKLTPEEIAAQQAEEDRQKNEATKDEARRELQQQISGKLEDPALEFNESVLKAVQADLIRNKRTLGLEKSDTEPPKELQSVRARVLLKAAVQNVRLEFVGKASNVEVSVAARGTSGPMMLAGAGQAMPRYSEKGWSDWQEIETQRIATVMAGARRPLQQQWETSWKARRANSSTPARDAVRRIDDAIGAALSAAKVLPAPVIGDQEFVRRAYLDAWGLIPTAEQARVFMQDTRSDKRERLIDSLLADDRWADPWVSYWTDVLAENPKIFGRVANSTGPFKRWIHRSLTGNHGLDRFATELILMEGTDAEYGTLGFTESLENDVPMAEKAFIVSQAFMAANMKCARCHDSPLNKFKQSDLFGLAAMLAGHPIAIPETSSVGAVPGRRAPAVTVTTKPGELVPASFVFDRAKDPRTIPEKDPRQYRASLASWMTGQRRFAEVAVNRIWKRYMGTGFVEPVDDWSPRYRASHPELLAFLTDEFITSGYSIKRIEELILKSQTWQRARDAKLSAVRSAERLPLFAALPVRRMYAEEVVDSLHLTVRRNFKSERMAYAAVDYGYPKRLWQVVTLSNEEDNAILARPLLQEIISAGIAFGWRDQRPDPRTTRDSDANPLQPLMLANGALVNRLVRLTDASHYAQLAKTDIGLADLTDHLFLNTLSRVPSQREREWVRSLLEPVWVERRAAEETQGPAAPAEEPVRAVRDMLDAYAYLAKARQSEPPARGLTAEYRTRFEEILWVLVNSPEFLFVP